VADAEKNTAKLITTYKDLHALSLKLHEQLKPLAEAKDVPAVPDLDETLIEAIESPETAGKPKDKDKDKDKDKAKNKAKK
jgi:hypothetical protein